MAKTQNTRTIVGSPLTPALLRELGVFDQFPPTPKEFDPNADWVNMYRIWACHGFRRSGNQSVGFLRISRTVAKPDEPFTLRLRREVVQVDGLVSTVEAEIKCLNNDLTSPVKWRLQCRFIDPNRQNLDHLGTDETAVVDGNTIEVRTRGARKFRRQVGRRFTSNWCLLEALQRLPFEENAIASFDMLEGLTLLKPNQRLSYRGAYPTKARVTELSLHRFDQLGDGILPYEYWLDENHRLLAVISHNKAYILDEQAESITAQIVDQLRSSYHRRTKAQSK
jgi:hypothetical protein